MASQSDFPSKWVCRSDDKDVRVEVLDTGTETNNVDLSVDTNVTTFLTGNKVKVGIYNYVGKLTEVEISLYANEYGFASTTSAEKADRKEKFVKIATLTLDDFEITEDPSVGEFYLATVENDEITVLDEITDNKKINYFVEKASISSVSETNWIEIPTSEVEHWIEKGEAAQIQRTTRVEFPTEWGEDTSETLHNSPRQLIESFNPTDAQPYQQARVTFDDPQSSEAEDGILQQYGWIGGVGGTSNSNKSKLWVYDFAELLSGVPTGLTFGEPTIKEAVEKIAREVNDNTPIPLSSVRIIGPQTEQEYTQVAENFRSEEQVTPLGLGPDFDAEENLAADGSAYYSITEDQFIDRSEVDFPLDEDETVTLPKTVGENFQATTIDTGSNVPDIIEPLGDTFGAIFGGALSAFTVLSMSYKNFSSNRDTLNDVFTWFEAKTGAKLHFEPLKNSVVLVADVTPSRRKWVQDDVVEAEGVARQVHGVLNVLSNNALYEGKPINTMNFRGAKQKGILNDAKTYAVGIAGAALLDYEPPAKKYPIVKVQHPALLDAADGFELSPPTVESDVAELDILKREAVRRFSERLSEPSEGEVVTEGFARLMPFDKMDAFEVCNNQTVFEQEPVEYEIESVKHEVVDGVYRSRMNVSIWANETNIEIVKDTHEETT